MRALEYSPLLLMLACAGPEPAPAPPPSGVCPPGACAPKTSDFFDAEPGSGVEFIDFAASRQANRRNEGSVLIDILEHLPPQYGSTYDDEDPITAGHETSHGIHSDLRNNHNNLGGRANGFYALEGRAAIIAEPGIRKSDANRHVPQSLRGSRYALYMAGSAAWDDTPTYIWDEWNAYVNGSAVGVDMVENGHWRRGWRDGVAGTLEFTVYAIALAMALEAREPDYLRSNTQFREYLAWNVRRGMDLYRRGAVMEAFTWDTQDAYWAAMKAAPDAEDFRAFCRRFFGAAWADAVIFGDGIVGEVDPGPGPGPDPDPGVEPDPDPGPDQPEPSGDGDEDGVLDDADLCRRTDPGARVWTWGEWKGCAEGQFRDPPGRGPDTDGDSVADSHDMCGGSPAGVAVWLWGEWLGCAEGQLRDRDL